MSNRLFQGIIFQMKDVVNRTIGVIDDSGIVVACSELTKMGEVRNGGRMDFSLVSGSITAGGYTYRPFGNQAKPEYAVFVEGEDRLADKMTGVIAISLTNIKSMYDEKYDKNALLKNILLDNILPSDIYAKAKELSLDQDEYRAVILIKFPQKPGINPFDIVSGIFPDRTKENILSIGEFDVAIVKELRKNTEGLELEEIAKSIFDTLSAEAYITVQIGIGSPVNNIKDLARSYKEAQIALDVGKIFGNSTNISSYESLGIGRLIYQLPTTLCEIFLSEVFKEDSIEALDRETLNTIQKFFENNLNVSETSRKLFVHRNTLVYRLEKIRKVIGLDLREFDHAVTFKVALMVKKYLDEKNGTEDFHL